MSSYNGHLRRTFVRNMGSNWWVLKSTCCSAVLLKIENRGKGNECPSSKAKPLWWFETIKSFHHSSFQGIWNCQNHLLAVVSDYCWSRFWDLGWEAKPGESTWIVPEFGYSQHKSYPKGRGRNESEIGWTGSREIWVLSQHSTHLDHTTMSVWEMESLDLWREKHQFLWFESRELWLHLCRSTNGSLTVLGFSCNNCLVNSRITISCRPRLYVW